MISKRCLNTMLHLNYNHNHLVSIFKYYYVPIQDIKFRHEIKLYSLFSASSQTSASIGTSFGRLNFEGAFGKTPSSLSASSTNKRKEPSRRVTIDEDEPSCSQSKNKRHRKDSISIPRNRATSSRHPLPDDDRNRNLNTRKHQRNDSDSSEDDFRAIFTENLFSQRENNLLQNDVLKLQKRKLEEKMAIEIETSKVDLEKKKIELETARQLAKIELDKKQRLAELEIEKMRQDLKK